MKPSGEHSQDELFLVTALVFRGPFRNRIDLLCWSVIGGSKRDWDASPEDLRKRLVNRAGPTFINEVAEESGFAAGEAV